MTKLVKIRLSENANTIMTAVAGSASLAVVGAILAEYLSAEASGIGHVIWLCNGDNKLDGIVLALLIIGFSNWLYIGVLEEVGKRLIQKVSKNTEDEQ